MTIPRVEDKIDIVETGYEYFGGGSAFTNTNTTGGRNKYIVGEENNNSNKNDEKENEGSKISNIIFSNEIGLAIEKPPNGLTLE